MPDIVIDYELLNQLGKDTDTLKHKVSDARTGDHNYSENEIGRVTWVVSLYYQAWSGAFKHAWDLLESLSGTYTAVAQQWFDQDAAYAATANEQAQGFTHAIWSMKKQAYDNWQKLSHEPITVHGFDKNGNPYEIQTTIADPDKPPEAPGDEPQHYEFTSADGSEHSTTSTYDSDGKLTSNDTYVTDGDGGMSYHEHTAFGDNGSYTSTVNHPDGSTTVETVHGNSDGTGTRTDVYTGPDGETTTTTYTGTGVGGDHPNPVWTNTDPDAAKDDDGGGDHDGGGSNGSHTGVGSTA
jgi:hypothetical protein